MAFYKANDLYTATLSSSYTAGQTVLSVNVVPDNVPTIITVAQGTAKETTFIVTGKTTNSLTGCARLKGYTGNLDAQMPVTCLNNEEFINQYGSSGVLPWHTVTYAETIEIDIVNGTKQVLTLTGDTVLTITGVPPGQAFLLKFIQDGIGGHTVTLFDTITWKSADYSFNTAANKSTILGFIETGTNAYDGFLVGKDY